MKIVYLSSNPHITRYDSTGASVHIREIIRAFQEQGHDVLPLIAGEGDKASPLTVASSSRLKRYIPYVLKSIRKDFLKLKHGFDFTRSVFSTVLAFQPDVIYERSEYLHRAGMVLSQKLGVPLVIEVNGKLAKDAVMFYGSPMHHLGELMEAMKYRYASAVFTIGSGLRDYVVNLGVDARKVFVTTNGVNLQLFDREKVNGRRVSEQLAFKDAVVVGFVGHMLPWHGIELLLSAAKLVVSRTPNVKFLIVGGGKSLSDFKASVAKEGLGEKVLFVGAVPNHKLPAFYAAMDIAVLPDTLSYGVNVKLFEYGAMALPVIAPTYPTITELIKHQSEGLLFTPQSTEELANAIVSLANNTALRRKLGKSFRQKVVSNYSWDIIGKKKLNIIQQIVE